ncbi:LysR family transcriptional regulator [Halorubellus sp. JP-L1]|uniref:LysR family transcriptional regulator n=1 Tax=Halorubellus sp. JP-L1 TaxID=2715753 RepID=UPI0014098266|nr:LysR family transcriptional regulator [Halorubellus sp. JP-L1]NHN43235.1 LysR family transcriptional regulator [Halorubellus sp. JP-L1]
MDAGFEAHLRAGDVTVDGDDAALLAAVDREGSLSAAADALDRSYSRAQKRVSALEEGLGALVERTRGGADGGGSRLTDAGRDLLARFARVRAAFADTAETDAAVLRGTVRDRDGELATVETAIGDVTALLFEDATDVQVAVRADAVTLHDATTAPDADASSARNRFAGTVAAVDRRESVALVEVTVGEEDGADGEEDGADAGATLPVLVTVDSLERLALEPGRGVVATFKATATRATPV